MSAITTHVLDTARGCPAEGVPVTLEAQQAEGGWTPVGKGVTDRDGRLKDLLPQGYVISEGVYRLTFDTGTYFAAHAVQSFYLSVVVVFTVRDAGQHYHVPLLLSPYGYSTYRGS
ncbi:MAG TPA: hydroxyisourate hydrolase [Pyrinomonadaceae bacterium]|nr:hydroxyisourate hydrolase [Pyrinomonadaceae bacterium]